MALLVPQMIYAHTPEFSAKHYKFILWISGILTEMAWEMYSLPFPPISVTLKNAAELLEFAAMYNAEQLKQSCLQFIVLNMAAILETR